MDFSPRTQYIINQIKANLKFILIGLVIITLFVIGSVMAITLLALIVITVPIIRLIKAHRSKSYKSKQRDIDDFIDVDYEIVDKKEK